ncbi:hypothetical protein IWZ00DRAFT_254913 [Phyllosticta capitalensis]|uniref:Secreted protein n=1 Tax=Phyllosticta capitalensis TaxID=121624 RepID=A0ABR1YVM6_9PEZI
MAVLSEDLCNAKVASSTLVVTILVLLLLLQPPFCWLALRAHSFAVFELGWWWCRGARGLGGAGCDAVPDSTNNLRHPTFLHYDCRGNRDNHF